jgi:DNA-binding response OmpR family regulator
LKEGDIIGRIVVMEFNDCNNTEQALFNEVMEIFNKYPVFQKIEINGKTSATTKNLKIFPVCRKVYCKDKQIALTQKEFDVFLYLAGQPGRVFTKEQILEAAGSEDSEDEDNAVRCLIAGIRKKLRKYTNKEYIQTVRGVGYRFMIPEE